MSMKELLETRIKQISHEPIREWVRRMLVEWSKNEATDMLIVSLGEYHSQLVDLRAEAARADPLMETSSGGLKKNPIFSMIDSAVTKISSMSRSLNIDPDIVFPGEGHD